jgi:hypothetical protein
MQLQPQPADQTGVSSRAADQTMLSGHGHMSPPPSNDPETTDPETAPWKHLPRPGTPTSTGRAGDRPPFQ